METNRQIEYVIGIDLGHGETSAAICPVQWDTPVEQLNPTTDLEMGGNKKVLPSAITLVGDKAYIGDAAFAPDILKKAKVRVCFKQAPKDVNGEAEQLMIRFMREVYLRIKESNSGMLTESNHLVYIATPSGWNRQTQNLYSQMAQMAGIPLGGITKESRAAFVRAQNDVTSGLGRNIEKGAIVFDMGSSTLDFTYMNKNLPKPIDNGYNCGASFIEKSIFADKESEDESIQLFKRKYPELVDYLVFEARKLKEEIYFQPDQLKKKTINFDDIIDDDELEDEKFKFKFQPGELNEQLIKKGYVKQIKDAMIDYRRNWIPDQKIYGVFMTGGAARMDFLKPLICECWGVDETMVYHDQNPSLTISEGVAEVARMDLRTDGMDQGLEESINAIQNSTAIYDTFIEEFGYYLWDKVTDAIWGTINYFGEATENYSLNDLQGGINDGAQKTITDESSKASEFMQKAIDEKLEKVKAKVENIIANYSKQGIHVETTSTNINSINVSGLNFNDLMNELSNSISKDSGHWGGAIAGAAIGGGIYAMLFAGPLGWIIGGGALVAKWLLSESDEVKRAKAMAKKLDLSNRLNVANALRNNAEEINTNVANCIRTSLESDKEVKAAINNVARQILEGYKENLKNARLLID